jgi:two-component SAPR family response regulator
MPIPMPSATPKPAAVKTAAPAPKPAVVAGKPVRAISAAKMETLGSVAKAVASSSALDEAMRFYQRAVQRGLSDRERIEVLETVLMRFGEAGAREVNPELERLRKRLKK